MSQRLLISKISNKTEADDCYQYVFHEFSNVSDLLCHWLHWDGMGYIGPLKLYIRDYDILDKFYAAWKTMDKMGVFRPEDALLEDLFAFDSNTRKPIHLDGQIYE